MRRLVFIDDDRTELEDFERIAGGDYEYNKIHWPAESEILFSIPAPDIFVSDLYLPARSGDTVPTGAERQTAARESKTVGVLFSELFAKQSDDKARLKETMKAIGKAYDMLELQWRALGQSPEHGVSLLREIRVRYPDVPVVFYSRKITPEDVVRVLQAGAVDAIRKGRLENDQVLARLEQAQRIFRQRELQSLRAQRLNINITVLST